MLRKAFAVIALGGLAAFVLGASGFFALRLYSAPLEHGLLSQTRRLQDLARDLQDEAQNISQADFAALAALRRDDARIGALMGRWRDEYTGGWRPAQAMVPVDRLRGVLARWKITHGQIADLLARERVLKGISRAITMLDKTADSLLSQSEKVVSDLINGGAGSRDVYLASRQIVLIQRISQHLHNLLKPSAWSGAFDQSAGYEDLVRDSALFEHNLEAMLKGDRRLEISRTPDAGVRQRLRDNGRLFASVNRDIGQILSMVPVLQDVRQTVQALRTSSRTFAEDSGGLSQDLVTLRSRHDTVFAALYLAALAALLTLLTFGVYERRRFRGRLDFSLAQSRQFKQALSALQPALEGLARGEMAAAELDAVPGVEGVIVPFNQTVARWRNTLTAIKGWTTKLGPLVERVNAAAGKVAEGAARQIEGVTASSAGLNRALSTVDQASTRVADTSRALEVLKAGAAAARTRMNETMGPDRAAARHAREQAERIDALVGRLNALAQGVEELSVMVLHLLVRFQDAGQAGHEPVSYANRALQVAHQCTEAVEQLDQGLTRIHEESGQLPVEDEPLKRQMEEYLTAADAHSDRVAGLLQETAPLLAELTAVLLSASDDLDSVHEYTMQASNETADASGEGKRIAELVEHIGRSIDQYNIMP